MGKKRHSLQISSAAYNKLSEFASLSGLSYTEFVDHLLGVRNNKSLTNKTRLNIDPNKAENSIRDSIPKPCQAVMDSSILMCWRNHKERDYEYWVGSNFTRGEIILSVSFHLTRTLDLNLEYRKFIMSNPFGSSNDIEKKDKPKTVNPFKKNPVDKNSVKTNSTWADLYPIFFKNHLSNRSNFETYFDNRLNALIKKGCITRTNEGFYSINKNRLTGKDWIVIGGVYDLTPQKNLNIPQLF